MSRAYVVDGYNLLFHLGFLERRGSAGALARARERLLQHIHDALARGGAAVTVVFDAARNRKSPLPQQWRGIEVRYSGGGDFADDVIEAMIAASPQPQELVVVSNDHRIQEAARRRCAQPWSCDQFLDHLETPVASPRLTRAEQPERPMPSPEEVRRWLEEFGDLADDPAFREVFDPYPFDEG
jgi:uncharacterized protein